MPINTQHDTKNKSLHSMQPIIGGIHCKSTPLYTHRTDGSVNTQHKAFIDHAETLPRLTDHYGEYVKFNADATPIIIRFANTAVIEDAGTPVFS